MVFQRSFIANVSFTFITVFCLHAQSVHAQSAGVDVDPLFRTSFEDMPAESFTNTKWSDLTVTVTGTAKVSSQFARTGDQCLHLLGDTDNSITLTLPKNLQTAKGIAFYAERWTSKDPFTFHVEVLQAGEWKRIAELDQVILVGKRFRSHIKLAIPQNSATTAIRFSMTAAPNAGVLIDDLALHANPPQSPTSLVPASLPHRQIELIDSQPLFVSGTHDTHTFRIPALVTATNGDLVAACDARRKSSADLIGQRTIDIVVRRSSDNGKTWTPMVVMNPASDGGCSDPSLLVDEITGDLFCFYNYMTSDRASKEFRFYVQKSVDHGKTWAEPTDITDQVAGPELKNAFKFITSGRGIQTRDGILIHNYVRVGEGVTLFASADHGKSWKTIGNVAPADESKVVELPDGTLMVNSRNAPGHRYIHRSQDQGKTWESEADFGLPDPRCNASIIQYTAKRDGFDKNRLVFCNAAANDDRKNLAIRISYDDGISWSEGGVIDSGPSAYSELTILSDGSFGVLYEPGYQEIRFARFTLQALTAGEDRLTKPWSSPNRSVGE